MDQETRWFTRYQEVMEFIETNHRNPSIILPGDRYLAAIGARLLLPGTCPQADLADVPQADFFA